MNDDHEPTHVTAMLAEIDVASLSEAEASALCQSCGACCGYSADWPRFSLESDEALARIPEAMVSASRGGMRCENDRCTALVGEIGVAAACGIYTDRPDVCRACMPGDEECLVARRKFGL